MKLKPRNCPTAATVILQVLLIALVAGLAAAVVVESMARRRLLDEHDELLGQSAQLASLSAQNQQLSNLLAQVPEPRPLTAAQLTELLRLRGEVSVFRQQQSQLIQARNQNSLVHSNLAICLKKSSTAGAQATANYWPQDSWANSGYATPEAALKSALWAGSNGDVTNFLSGVTGPLQDEIMGDVKKDSASKVAAKLAEETYDLKSVQILDRTSLPNGSVQLTVELESDDQKLTAKMVLQQIGGEWKLASTQ
jgi:hypothetical protein